jgi:thiol-disulfide isomerase/thioredoxin
LILQRLLAALVISGILVLAYRLIQRNSLENKARRILELDQYQLGRPAVLYFTSPGCVPCKTIQRPALAQVQELWRDDLQIITIDALDHPTMADRWGVLSVPTTFIIDPRGQPRTVNHGVTKAQTLIKQIEALSEVNPQADNNVAGRVGRIKQAWLDWGKMLKELRRKYVESRHS